MYVENVNHLENIRYSYSFKDTKYVFIACFKMFSFVIKIQNMLHILSIWGVAYSAGVYYRSMRQIKQKNIYCSWNSH